MTECYLNNMETTMVLLVMERPAFGKLSALMLAARGYSYKFMEHSACQEYMNRVWLNTLAHKGNSLRVHSRPFFSNCTNAMQCKIADEALWLAKTVLMRWSNLQVVTYTYTVVRPLKSGNAHRMFHKRMMHGPRLAHELVLSDIRLAQHPPHSLCPYPPVSSVRTFSRRPKARSGAGKSYPWNGRGTA
ncbi:unnamed protein product [Schistocephalus solidus]|uniref:Uncharacterized protein n=1 Tax=Schistocephalus solidus TaxID=70667 RepID=A0A3P7BPD4_SCHSO|nr:unnamed protein product [Schistocephalus solidus]